MQQRFVSDVSHELRTPLTTIRMAVDLIHESRTGFDLRRPLGRAARRRARPVRGAARTCSRSAASTPAPPLSTSSRSTCAARSPRSRRPGRSLSAWSEVVVHRPTSPPRPRSTSAGSSASCATSSSTPSSTARAAVDIHAAVGDDAVAVVVEDHGVGLRPGEAANVFTRFWRADPARARTTGGTGLGLSISLEDARLHNGWLQAWGAPGRARASASPCRSAPGRPCTARRCRSAPRRTRDGAAPRGALGARRARPRRAAAGSPRRPGGAGLDVGSGNPPDLRLSPARCPAQGRRASCGGSCAPGRRATRRTTTPGPSSSRSERQLEPGRHDRPARRRRAPSATLLDPATVRITARAAGTVDADGRYTAARPGSTVTATFRLRP